MGNVCAVRYILENGRDFKHGKTSDYCETIPHEPVMVESHAKRFDVPTHISQGSIKKAQKVDVCRHCGCLYMEAP